jgi:hypothetical protein
MLVRLLLILALLVALDDALMGYPEEPSGACEF